MSSTLGQNGVLQVVPPAALEQQLQKQDAAYAAANKQEAKQDLTQLGGYIRGQFEIFRNHRNTAAGWSERMLMALRAFNGQYDAGKLAEIRKFGGSEVYARLIAQKCRAASSLLRDIYLGPDRPWALRPPADPKIPDSIIKRIDSLLDVEQQMIARSGQPVNPDDFKERRRALVDSARDAAKKRSASQARDSEDKVETILRDGGFYHALAEFLVDVTIFPFAVIKGPVVRVMPEVVWPEGGGMPQVKQTPRLTWQRVSPFDMWFTPGVACIENANCIEKLRVTRAELNELLDLPGYDHEEIRAVLTEYGAGGLYDNWDTTDAERAALESKENPAWNRSALISMMEFNGNVQGRTLQEYGIAVQDEIRDYSVQAWMVGSHIIKAHLSPSPRQRHPYFITSFEKVPGTVIGNGLTDLLTDIQEVSNATVRALVNNLSIASGPQVVVNTDRLHPDENPLDLHPWKKWLIRDNAFGNNAQMPISFFMPTSNAQQLISVFQEFASIADDVSAIPKYVGGQAGGGAGRTASGLAMLMGNASKILQTVSANIDRDVIEPAMLQLSDLILLTDTSGLLTGEEQITVQGVNVAIQRETLRQRQIEFLQATANPLDQKIMGIGGRGKVLRSVSSTIGMDGDRIVPTDEQLDKMQEAQMKNAENEAIEKSVQQGVQKGVEMGVQKISSELTQGALAQRAVIPPAAAPPRPATNNPAMDLGHEAAQAQGSQPSPLSESVGPQTSLTGSQPGPGAKQVSGGVG